MGKRKIFFGLAVFIFLLATLIPYNFSWAQTALPPVVAIRVEGNEKISTNLILSAVSLSLKEPFNQEKVQNDVKAIYELGYFSRVWVETKEYPDGIEVIYKVEELPVVKEIQISGNTAIEDSLIQEAMILSPGQVMNWQILQNDFERIRALYSDNGFLITGIDQIDFSPEGILSFSIREGIIEDVRFEGLEKTKEYVVRRELVFEPPIVFDFAEVTKSIQAIYDLGFFKDISMKLEPGSDVDHVIVKVSVVEESTGEAAVGVGYNTEDGWLGYVRYQESNLGGNSQRVELRYEFGARTLYQFSFEEPYLFGSPTYSRLELYDQVRDRNNWEEGEIIGKYEEERIGWQLTFGREIDEEWAWRLRYKSEDIQTTALEGIIPANGGITNSLTPMVLYDTRDSKTNPHEGWLGTLQVELAGGAFGGDYDFNKYILDVRNFTDTGEDTVLALRLMGGIADTYLPDYEKFGVGGVSTLRGYDLFEFEGEKMIVFNAEYRWEVAEDTQLVLFGDAGYAWALDEAISFDSLKTGYGVGLRLDTPIGPVRLDYGIGERGGQTYFSLGHTF
ncbi:MAG: outer membrane protein insertion porin family [Candidatus Atribacteria bacterium]|nr:outer membrane protein insertion porin family [Candidatus Atribacteria bacterium]